MTVSLYEAMMDPDLLGRTFGRPTFTNWRTVAKILEGLPLTAEEAQLAGSVTGGRTDMAAGAVRRAIQECYFVKPRRAGGTLFSAAVGLHAGLQDYRDRLGPGEVATVALIACDRRQARQLMNYISGLIDDSPLIGAEVSGRTQDTISFSHRVNLEIHIPSFRSTRGYTYAAVILDELAYFRDDTSASPDIELVRAVRPGLATLNGRLLGLSSPHARRGHLFAMHQQHYGKASDVLVISATHSQLNPTIDPKVVERAMAEDPEAARSEWFGEFRSDVSQFLPDELIDAALEPGRLPRGSERPPVAFVDMSGGLHDASVLAIAHSERTIRSAGQWGTTPAGKPSAPIVRLDALHAVPAPHKPAAVVQQFAEILKDKGLRRVTGDRYAGAWVADAFKTCGIRYETSELDKNAIYCEALPLFSERRVELLEDKRLITELRLLERRPRAGGRGDVVDHPPRGHDDCANAAVGALLLAAARRPEIKISDATLRASDDFPYSL